ncbi:zf-HC2 domain-containing protein [Hymenobacter sp. HD11105]
MPNASNPSECLDVADLLVDYARHTLPPEHTTRMAAHLTHCPRCQERVAQVQALIGELATVEKVTSPPGLRANLLTLLAQEKARVNQPSTAAAEAHMVPLQPAPAVAAGTWWLRIAASGVLLAVGLVLGNLWRPLSADVSVRTRVNAEVSPPRLHALTSDPTAPTLSASARIQLVSELAGEAQGKDDPVVQVLINTLNFDPNANVRLAAGKALFRLRADPRVGEAFLQSLPIQTDPYVQILLIELLVDLREQRAVPELERLAQRPDALPLVRQQAKSGLGLLI